VKYNSIWTPTQKADLLDSRTRLNRQLARFRSLQSTYMPAAIRRLTNTDDSSSGNESSLSATGSKKRKGSKPPNSDDDVPDKPDPVEKQQLFLPSALSMDENDAGCHPGLADIENSMRDAQCRTSLDQIRTQLYIKSRLLTYKDRHVRHQGSSTRTRSVIDQNDIKIKVLRDKYNTARTALIALAGGSVEGLEWREMTEADIRCLEDPEEDKKREQWARNRIERQKKNAESGLEVPGPGEGHRKLSWIWEGAGRDPDASTGLHEGGFPHFLCVRFSNQQFPALRVEWAKARARSFRWTEEVALLKEEMRRVLAFLEYKVRWWEERAGGNFGEGSVREGGMTESHSEGVRAYAIGQGRLLHDLAKKFDRMWDAVRRDQVDTGNQVAGAEESEDELDGAGEGSEEEMEENEGDEADMDGEEFTYDD
jgi:hypothetical protein